MLPIVFKKEEEEEEGKLFIMANGGDIGCSKYIVKDGIEFRLPHTFKTPLPSKIVHSYAEMSGLEIIAYHGRRARKAIPDYWPNVVLLSEEKEKVNTRKKQ